MTSLCVEARFCGPPGSANGGYFAGLLAALSPQAVQVRLERPIPLQAVLQVARDAHGMVQVAHQQQIVATARPQTLELAVPPPPTYLQALDASRHFIGFGQHAYPQCFVCGTRRARGDGLRIFAGALGGEDMVAATWVPDPSLGAADGKVGAQFMSAALDCPGYFAARSDGVPMLLGEFNAHVDRCVHIDEPCIILGWRLSVRGRKFEVGTALFDDDGNLCARARALWIEPRAP